MSKHETKIFFLQLFSILNVKISEEDLVKQLQKYLFSPLISDISKMLHIWNIKNMVIKDVPLDNLNNAPTPIISLTKKNELFLINEILDEKYICFFHNSQKEKLISKNSFLALTKGIYILIEANEHSGEINFDEKKQIIKTVRISSIIILLSFFIITTLGFFIVKTKNLLFYSLITLGLTTSIYLLLKEYYFFSNSNFDICKIGKRFDCDSIIRSKESKIFNFSLAEISTGFFIFLMLFCIQSEITNMPLGLIAPLIYTSIIGIVYSLIQQVRMKSFCILCLVISLILISLVITADTYLRLELMLLKGSAINIVLSFGVTLLLLFLLRGYLFFYKDSKINKTNLHNLLNSSLLINSLGQHKINSINFNNEIFIGTRDREFEMILFMNPLCNKCKNILNNLPRLFSEFENQIFLRILYSGPADNSARAKLKFADLYKEIERNNEQEKITLVSTYNFDSEVDDTYDINLLDCLTNQYNWSNELDLEGTPTIILNQMKLPSFFGVEEICSLLRNVVEK
ncbi:vitamin K epoxide reductase family protein [Cellulophaga baltica]|uniref:vitamin K epoxide reductase family protein n=1 Tax=Cellulophaga baltica TaxID=76594 RepID=UPI0021494795|nr:vitamin K epoxide reductase family protein [Cellulophaga baltica]MCR1025766.1 vitamin K epoxide reductase family protein [Cellulophaga baltica]